MYSNPQALAAVSKRLEFGGDPALSTPADADTWLTPRYILAELGDFDLDPCAASQRPDWVSPTHYTALEDGLRCPWNGRVFLNPPFSNTVPWLHKHAEHGTGIALVPASIESQVWRDVVWKRAKAILLLHGRTRFCNPDGSTTTGRPLRPVCLIAWDGIEAALLSRSQLAGTLLTDWRQR